MLLPSGPLQFSSAELMPSRWNTVEVIVIVLIWSFLNDGSGIYLGLIIGSCCDVGFCCTTILMFLCCGVPLAVNTASFWLQDSIPVPNSSLVWYKPIDNGFPSCWGSCVGRRVSIGLLLLTGAETTATFALFLFSVSSLFSIETSTAAAPAPNVTFESGRPLISSIDLASPAISILSGPVPRVMASSFFGSS